MDSFGHASTVVPDYDYVITPGDSVREVFCGVLGTHGIRLLTTTIDDRTGFQTDAMRSRPFMSLMMMRRWEVVRMPMRR